MVTTGFGVNDRPSNIRAARIAVRQRRRSVVVVLAVSLDSVMRSVHGINGPAGIAGTTEKGY